MRYFNSTDVQNFDKKILLESYYFEKKASYDSFDVFLSHSSKDKHILPSVINFLSEYDVNVYIDKNDKELPERTSSKTGEILKTRIQESNKFVVLVSQNSKESKWIPWELGFADVKKKVNNIALLPNEDNFFKSNWVDQEYLGLYPRIVFGALGGHTKQVWMVWMHHVNKAIELSEWLKLK